MRELTHKFALTAVLLVGLFAFAQAAHADTIDFNSDSAGYHGTSWASDDSSLVTFSAAALYTYHYGVNGPALLANGGLTMSFSTEVSSLSMLFGNDDPAATTSEDRARLTVYLNGAQVGQSVVVWNDNDAVDETISISGVGAFDTAVLTYTNSSGQTGNLAEAVDNVTFSPVPEPTTLALFGLGAGALALRRRRRKLA